mmetsp:Transcript_28492/g.93085  ORF Transcript_28492/g.93085 Transcript_28492/m.93085 type:complete len:346 (-) Transcript_28492:418-1455(-)|eukprot:CAMPEP_0170148030 /NCGR_PEP_ID=MMETSP0033_2-20121228/37047_1 /TAXON_ID=195969 /ORGANISM="Dolichomastix tenuilepis, Strain CCMP3274" /LENGTH=345 /DNA_ID=CAMNT_0010384887 /DNA_START=106 /DNA_END=1143 /DNA_ORIENTATION=-
MEDEQEVPPYRNEAQDVVRTAFKPGFNGIRSLPNAITPSFRQQAHEDMLQSARSGQSATASLTARARARIAQRPGPKVTGTPAPLSEPVAMGQRKPGQFTSTPKMFTIYDYQPDEFEREREIKRQETEKSKSQWIVKEDFKRTALPPVPKSAGSFNEFEYAIDPFELKDEQLKAERLERNMKTLHGPVRAAGHASPGEQCKMRRDEALGQLERVLKADWAEGFLRVFEDDLGLIVCCFDKDKVKGDLSTYMNQLFRTNDTVTQYKLKKDPVRWGIAEKGVSNVYYIFIPPWVHVRIEPDLNLPKPDPFQPEPALVSSRIPFAPQTSGGNLVHVHVRTFNRSFKYS